MKFIRSQAQLRPHHRGCVATIGNFDGVHRGHQVIIQQVKARAQQLDLPVVIIIFEPQPQEFFAPQYAPPRLTRLREKLLAFQEYQVDAVLCLQFNRQFAQLTANDFIQHILLDGLHIKHLVVGDDFHFGKQRQGNFATLQHAGQQHDFTVENCHTVIWEGERISSTRTRSALAHGNLTTVQQLLGRPYRLSGRVRHGQQLGRSIGFPTANIFLHRAKSPILGVFAVKFYGVTEEPLCGVANLGTRPTVGGSRVLLEVHLFDFNQSIYGRYVEVEFIQQLRPEKKFPSFDDLKQQIQLDVQAARNVFACKSAENAVK
jgi:riboflavin kinase / FMN adenylyltransferase